jgi:hypothetical protein
MALWLVAACADAPGPKPPVPAKSAPAVDMSGWRDWPKANPERLWSRAHKRRFVDVHVEPRYLEAYRAGETMPQGARVAKAVYEDLAGARLANVVVMAKMAPGYDADDRDWYYAVYASDGVTVKARGRIEMCISCHIQADDRDYLFRPQGRGSWTDGWKASDAAPRP